MDKGSIISINDDILTQYLLNTQHKFGKRKNKLLKRLGYNMSNIDKLKRELEELALNNKTVILDSIYDTTLIFKAEVDGILKGINNNCVYIKTFWIQSSYKVEFLTLTLS